MSWDRFFLKLAENFPHHNSSAYSQCGHCCGLYGSRICYKFADFLFSFQVSVVSKPVILTLILNLLGMPPCHLLWGGGGGCGGVGGGGVGVGGWGGGGTGGHACVSCCFLPPFLTLNPFLHA